MVANTKSKLEGKDLYNKKNHKILLSCNGKNLQYVWEWIPRVSDQEERRVILDWVGYFALGALARDSMFNMLT